MSSFLRGNKGEVQPRWLQAGATASHKLISVDFVEWENICGAEAGNSYNRKSVRCELS